MYIIYCSKFHIHWFCSLSLSNICWLLVQVSALISWLADSTGERENNTEYVKLADKFHPYGPYSGSNGEFFPLGFDLPNHSFKIFPQLHKLLKMLFTYVAIDWSRRSWAKSVFCLLVKYVTLLLRWKNAGRHNGEFPFCVRSVVPGTTGSPRGLQKGKMC